MQNLSIFWRVAEAFDCLVNLLTLETPHVVAEELVKMELKELVLGKLQEHSAKFIHGLSSFILLANFGHWGPRDVWFGSLGNSYPWCWNISLNLFLLDFKFWILGIWFNFHNSSKIRHKIRKPINRKFLKVIPDALDAHWECPDRISVNQESL